MPQQRVQTLSERVYKIMASHLGKPWAKIRNGMQVGLSADTKLNAHLRMLVFEHLVLRVREEILVDKAFFYDAESTLGRLPRLEMGSLFVHPRTKTLEMAGLCPVYSDEQIKEMATSSGQRAKKPQKLAEDILYLGKSTFLCKCADGKWCEVEYKMKVTPSHFKDGRFGHIEAREHNKGLAYSVRQLQARALKTFGLEND